MRMPRSKSNDIQLDLLGGIADADAPGPPPTATAPRAVGWTPLLLPVADLYVDPGNLRSEVPAAELDGLAEDIHQRGILQPIVVHRADADGRHRIPFGAKRWRASQRIWLQGT